MGAFVAFVLYNQRRSLDVRMFRVTGVITNKKRSFIKFSESADNEGGTSFTVSYSKGDGTVEPGFSWEPGNAPAAYIHASDCTPCGVEVHGSDPFFQAFYVVGQDRDRRS